MLCNFLKATDRDYGTAGRKTGNPGKAFARLTWGTFTEVYGIKTLEKWYYSLYP